MRLVLTVAGTAAGIAAALLIPGVGVPLGMAIASAGSMVGGIAGSLLFPPEPAGGQLQRPLDIKWQGATYGNPITKIYGTNRVAGNMIWTSGVKAIPWEEDTGGGKGGADPGPNTWLYKASFDMAICVANDKARLLRIWADSKLIYDVTSKNKKLTKPVGLNFTFYNGTETQLPDPTEESFLGAGNVPAYRGLCRIVFDGMWLQNYGGRYPNLNFEVTMNENQSFPYNEWAMSFSFWGTDAFRIDSTGTWLYTWSSNHFYIMNMINNVWKLENINPTTFGIFGYNSCVPDITDEQGWWVTKYFRANYALFGKMDEFLASKYEYVLAPSGEPMNYPAPIGGVTNCGPDGNIWLWGTARPTRS